MAFYRRKKNKKWIIKALDRKTRKTIAWVIGNRGAKTFRKLYNKVKHLKKCIFYTDNWDTFSKILPRKRHGIGKKHTCAIERDNSNTRHHLGRMTRRTKVVSKSEQMLDLSIRIWVHLNEPNVVKELQDNFLSIFR